MWRWFTCTFSAICLLLAVATAVLWVRSYWSDDSIRYVAEAGYYVDFSAGTEPGRVCVYLNMRLAPHTADQGWRVTSHSYRHMPAWLQPKEYPLLSMGFAWESFRLGAERMTREFASPFWAPVGVFSIGATTLWLPWTRRRLRRRRDLCEKCGYDLRASPERCPECGTVRHHDGKAAKPPTPVE
jgi:hypothetical protein